MVVTLGLCGFEAKLKVRTNLNALKLLKSYQTFKLCIIIVITLSLVTNAEVSKDLV